MAQQGMISADSHATEPRNLWVKRMGKKFRDRAPRVVKDPPGLKGEWFVCEGVEPRPATLGFAAGKKPEEYNEFQKATSYEDLLPGGWEAAPRLKDMALDGIEAEVIYTTLCFRLFSLLDEPFQREIFRVYNDWLAELCRYDPRRLLGLALIPLLDVEAGCIELERAARLGLRGAMIMCSPPEGQSYAESRFDPFWARAQDLGMPLSLHLGTGHSKDDRYLDPYMRSAMSPHEAQFTFSTLLFGGVMQRYPDLKFVSAENDIGWIAHYLARADNAFRKFAGFRAQKLRGAKPGNFGAPLDMPPSDYWRRQVYATFMDDVVGVQTARFFGEDNYMWANDYPHLMATWPRSQQAVDRMFQGIGDDVKWKIVRDNAARLYHIDLSP